MSLKSDVKRLETRAGELGGDACPHGYAIRYESDGGLNQSDDPLCPICGRERDIISVEYVIEMTEGKR